MRTRDDVAAMLQLKGVDWGIKRIALELRCSPLAVRRYQAEGDHGAYDVWPVGEACPGVLNK